MFTPVGSSRSAFETLQMRLPFYPKSRASPQPRTKAPRWLRNERGAAAIEFAIVALPFFLFVLGIVGIGLYFFTANALEHGVEAAARKIRTGEAQNGALTVGQFKQLVCSEAGSYIKCDKLRVHIQHASSWSAITPQACVDSNNDMVESTGSSGDALSDYSGVASQVVLVTLCYEWDLAKSFAFLHLGKNADGSGPAIVQAATAFRTEPYS
jgi:Flp pilus assembly protein TadG